MMRLAVLLARQDAAYSMARLLRGEWTCGTQRRVRCWNWGKPNDSTYDLKIDAGLQVAEVALGEGVVLDVEAAVDLTGKGE